METWFERWYHQQEERHWWFRSRRVFIRLLLKRFQVSKSASIVDVGCASGMNLLELNAAGYTNLQGVDLSEVAIAACKKRGVTSVETADAHQLPSFVSPPELLIASDLLEHLADDHKALQNWKNTLAENGLLFLIVPAHPELWSQHDVWNHHFRRYRKKELLELIRSEGFEIVESGYWNALLFPLIYLFRMLKKKLPVSTEKNDLSTSQNPVINRLGMAVFGLEHWLWKRGARFPFGVSLYVVARKENEVCEANADP